MTPKPNQNKKTILSKLRQYSKLILVLTGILFAITAFVVGGTLAGWNILGWLKSPMAILIYFLLVLAGAVYIFRKFYKRRY